MSLEPKVYIACLASYNNGILHGSWIDAAQDTEELQKAVQIMLSESPITGAEEFAIHDYEDFGGITLCEYEGLASASEKALFIAKHGELGAAILNHWCDDIDDASKALEDHYCGCHESVEDYARGLTEDTQDIPKNLEFYIDYERMGQDMELSGAIYSIKTAYQEVHVFWSH